MLAAALALAVLLPAATLATPPMPRTATVRVGPAGSAAAFPHSWQASVGSGHARLGLRADWQAQLARAHTELGIEAVRFHGIFDDDMGPVVVRGDGGTPAYNFTLVDAVYDGIVKGGVAPLVELSFMPRALANCTARNRTCQTTMHYRGVVDSPASYDEWHDLVRATATHLVGRYGLAAVSGWRFEVWNELWGMQDFDHYMRLYNASWHAIKSVSPRLAIGGPATAEVERVADFVGRLAAYGVEADFVSTHLYPTDFCNQQNTSEPDCFTATVRGARRQAPHHEFLMTEFNCGWRNDAIHDGESSSYAGAFLLHTLRHLRADGVAALSWWTFSSIFEEGQLPTNEFGPFGANSALQTVHGVRLPIYRCYEMLNAAGATLRTTAGDEGPISVLATDVSPGDASAPAELRIYVASFLPDDSTGWATGSTALTLEVEAGAGAGEQATAVLTVVNSTCANPKQAWAAMGSPTWPSASQLAALNAASAPCTQALPVERVGGAGSPLRLRLDLEAYAFGVIVLKL